MEILHLLVDVDQPIYSSSEEQFHLPDLVREEMSHLAIMLRQLFELCTISCVIDVGVTFVCAYDHSLL